LTREDDGRATPSIPTPGVRRVVGDLFDEHADAIHAFVARRLGPDVARDVVAEVFRVALESFGAYDPDRGAPRAWLYGIAANLVRRHWRSEARRLSALGRMAARTDDVELGTTDSVDGRLDAEARLRVLVQRIAHLAPDDRDLLLLVAWEGVSYRDAAAALAIPEGTIASRLNRIRSLLRSEDPHDD
jgi:RNA polymerase sigma-70 factor (ECF subfamily)